MTPRILLASLLLLALAAPASWAGTGGGSVSNAAPTVQSFSGNKASIDNNAASAEVFTMTVFDANGEADLQSVKIASTNSAFGTQTWTAPMACASPPAGWTCTDSTPNDGVLVVTFTYTWPAATATGTYTQTPSVKDEGSYVAGATETTTITASAVLSFTANQVYDATGAAVAQNWGNWVVSPGASNVNAINYLKAVNTGTASGAVSVNFQETAFAGPGSGSIAIDGNVKFCTASTTDTSPQPPNALTFSCDATASVDGSRSFTIASHATLWIGYQLANLPAVLPDGAYSASYSGA